MPARLLVLLLLIGFARGVSAQATLGADLDADRDDRITEGELAAHLDAHRDVRETDDSAPQLIARCDIERANGVIDTTAERDCLAAQPLRIGREPTIGDLRFRQPTGTPLQNLSFALTSPAEVRDPASVADSTGELALWAIVTALMGVFAAWSTERGILVTGWIFRRSTRGAWFRLPRAVLVLTGVTVGIVIALILLVALLASGEWWPASRAELAGWFVPLPAPQTNVELEWILVGVVPLFAVMRAHRLGHVANRTRMLERATGTPAPAAVPTGFARRRPLRIVICSDGTGNQADAMEEGRRSVSNVRKFYERLMTHTASGWDQYAWYDPGVGTSTSRPATRLAWGSRLLSLIGAAIPARILNYVHKFRMIAELGFGVGITENIAEGYRQIVEHYQRGDQIVLIGFSRGAYTARCIAGVISRAGLLRAEHAIFVDDIVRLYRYRGRSTAPIDVWPQLMHDDVRVDFLGLWDTVSSLGVPLWGWTFSIGGLWSNKALDTSPARVCRVVRHALSVDEERSQFMPTLFNERTAGQGQDIKQLWFRGSHAGVGGGYAECELSDVSLQWMIDEAARVGLQFTAEPLVTGSPLGTIRTELDREPFWQISGYWPRWHPCEAADLQTGAYPRTGFGALHPSVASRATHATRFRDPHSAVTSDELHVPSAGSSALVTIRADCAWNRTGLVLERGKAYRVTYVGGEWRDSEHRPCGPYGQDSTGWTDLRRYGEWRRRVKDGRWMELILHVAHPRPWPLHELPGRKLLSLLIVRTPLRLHRTLLRAGAHLPTPGASVDIVVRSHSGILYGFANDWWMFHRNNSGAVTLDVAEIPAPQPEHFIVMPNGRVRWASGEQSPGRHVAAGSDGTRSVPAE